MMPTFDEMTKYLDQKKLITILKRFLDTKASAPEIAKYFELHIEDVFLFEEE